MSRTSRSGHPRWRRLTLLAVTSIALLTLDLRHVGVVEAARRVTATALSPLSEAVDTIVEPLRTAWGGVTGYGHLRDERDRLRAQVDRLEGAQREADIADDQLRAVLEQDRIPWIGDVPRTVARVVSGPTSNFSHTINIEKGSSAGVRAGMPVVSGAGLVGRVQQVTSSGAVVQLLSDPAFRVGVRLLPSGPFGTASGSGEGRPLVVDTALSRSDAVPTDGLLVTSGAAESAFPSSIPVATLRGSRPAENGLTLDLLADPFVDPQQLGFVTVLLTTDEDR
jgi:rod shape-determining protein MreC